MAKLFRKAIILPSVLLFLLYVLLGNTPLQFLVQPTPALASEPARATWNDTVANAKKEGAVVVYAASSGVAARTALVPKIKELFGINMDVVSAPTDELSQKIFTERQRGLYFADAFIHGQQMLGSTYAGVFSPLDKFLILPEATDPKAWPNGRLPFIDKNRLTVGLTGAYWSWILINTDMVKPGELKSYADLVDPKWKGKIIMNDPSIGGAGVNWLTFIMRIMGPEKGEKFLRQLATQQDLMVSRDARLPAEWVARGKYPVAIAPPIVTPLLKAGAPISWVRMSEGGAVHPSPNIFGIVDKAPHPNAAKVLFNWLLTAEGQYVFSQAAGQPATRLGVSTVGIDPFTIPRPGEKLFWVDEKFLMDVDTKGRELGKEIFGHLLK